MSAPAHELPGGRRRAGAADPATLSPARVRGGLRRAMVNLWFLGSSQLAVAVAAFATQALLARSLPQDQFGMFMTVMAVVSLTAPVAVFGVSELWLQQFGHEGDRAYRWVARSLRLVALCSTALVVVLLGWSVLDGAGQVTGRVRALLASVVVAQALAALATSVLQLRGAYRGVAGFLLLPHAGRVVVILLVWLSGLSVTATATGYAVTALVTCVVSLVILAPFRRAELVLEGHRGGPPPAGQPVGRHRAPEPPVTEPGLAAVAAAGLPFLLGSVFYLLGMNLGTVVAGEFLSAESAAVFAVPMSIMMAVYLVPRVIYQQYFLPKFYRWASSDTEGIVMAYRVGTWGMIVLGVLVGAALVAVGWFAIPLVFGPAYSASAPVLAVLALAVPLRFGAASVAALLTSAGLVRRKVVHQGIGAAVYLVSLAVLTPWYGLPGAAAASVLAEAALLALFWGAVRRRVIEGAALPSWPAIYRCLLRD